MRHHQLHKKSGNRTFNRPVFALAFPNSAQMQTEQSQKKIDAVTILDDKLCRKPRLREDYVMIERLIRFEAKLICRSYNVLHEVTLSIVGMTCSYILADPS